MRDVDFGKDGQAAKPVATTGLVSPSRAVRSGDWAAAERLDRAAALQQADVRFLAFLALYEARAAGHRAPFSREITAEDMLASGISGRIMRLRLPPRTEHPGPSVPGKPFPGQVFEYVNMPHGAKMLAHPLVAQALSRRLVGVCLLARSDFMSIVGRLGDGFVYKIAVALPLRGEQGEIADILLPFCDKLGNVPLRLRQEFFSRDV